MTDFACAFRITFKSKIAAIIIQFTCRRKMRTRSQTKALTTREAILELGRQIRFLFDNPFILFSPHHRWRQECLRPDERIGFPFYNCCWGCRQLIDQRSKDDLCCYPPSNETNDFSSWSFWYNRIWMTFQDLIETCQSQDEFLHHVEILRISIIDFWQSRFPDSLNFQDYLE